MPETISVQNAFTSGELSPRLYGRTDLSKYRSGLTTQLNFITQKHGGLIRRSGSRFVAETKDSAASTDRKARVVEFQFSTQQTYVLEFGELYIRFYRDKGQLKHGTIFTVTNATFAASVSTITTSVNHNIDIGDSISVKGVLTDDAAFPIGFDGTFTVTAITSNTVSYALASQPPGTYSSGGTVVETTGAIATEIVSPYTAAQLPQLKWAQSADILYLAHPSHEPRLLKRTSGADADPAVWQLVKLDPQDGPYLPFNTVAAALITVPVGAIGDTGTVTLSDAAVAEINDGRGFLSTDVGRTISWFESSSLRWAEITTFTDRQNVIVTLKTTSLANTLDQWRVGAWSDTDGWPFTVNFHQDRLWWGGSPALPQTLWSSETGDFVGYADREPDESVTAENAVVLTINDDKVNTIHWLLSDDRGLILLTNGGNFILSGPSDLGISAESPPIAKHQTTEPASQLAQPHRIGGVTLMVASSDRKVLEFVFTFELERYVAPDLTILSEHITLGGITDTALQVEPDNILWCVRADGALLSLTYERAENVVAWGEHVIGGTLAGETQAQVESVAVIRDGSDDLVWLIVKRTVNGLTKRYVEFLDPLFDDDQLSEDGFFVDSGLTLNTPIAITAATKANPVVVTAVAHGLSAGDRVRIRKVKGMTELNDRSYLVAAPTADTLELQDTSGNPIDGTAFSTYVSGGNVYREVQQMTGFDHLIGETVKVLADGGAHADKVVSSGGAITLDRFASIVHGGFGYTYRMTTLPLVSGQAIEARGRVMRIDHVTARFNRSLGGNLGDLIKDPVVHRKPSDPMGAPPPLFSGRKKLPTSGRHDQDVTATLEGDQPLPMNLLSLEIEAGVEGL